MSDSNSSSGGIGICGCIFIVFITLKLCGVINWSWWWVTAPLWGPFGLVVAVFLVIGAVALLMAIITAVGAWASSGK